MANQDREFLLMKFVNFHFPDDDSDSADSARFAAMKKFYARDGVHLNFKILGQSGIVREINYGRRN